MSRAGEQTRLALIAAAERLFARDGLAGATISAITREAGQRNNYAVGWHFGGKDELLEAILDKHQGRVNEVRERLLDEPAGLAADPMLIARALVEPLAMRLLDPDGGADFLRIQAELLSRRAPEGVDEPREAVRRLFEMVESLGGAASRTNARDQGALIIAIVFHGLADFAAREPDASNSRVADFTELLVRDVAAILDFGSATK